MHQWRLSLQKILHKKRKAFVESIVVFIVVLENTELWKIQNQLL